MFEKWIKPDVEKLKKKRDINGLIKALEYQDDAQVRIGAAKALGQLRNTSSINPLSQALLDSDLSVRKAAAEALGQLRAIPSLLKACENNDGVVRKVAVETLDNLGWKPDQGENGARYLFAKGKFEECLALGKVSVDIFIKALGDRDQNVQEIAAKALGQLGDSRAVDPLINSLGSIGQIAAQALGQLGDPVVEPLIKVLGYGNKDMRAQAVGVLGQLKDVRAVEPLIKILLDRDKALREAAAKALDKIGWKPEQGEAAAIYWITKGNFTKCLAIGKSAAPALIKTLADVDHEVREEAARALGQLHDPRAVEPLIRALEKPDQGRWVREAAATALGQLGDARAVEPLIKAFNDDNVKWKAINALVQLGDVSVGPLLRVLSNTQGWVCYAAAEALGQLGDVRAVDPLIKILGEYRQGQEGHAAVKALGKLGDLRALEPLIKALGNNALAADAAEALGQLGDKRALEPLLAALQSTAYNVPEAALGALGQLGDARAVEPLIKMLGNYVLGGHAARTLGKLRDARAVEPLIGALGHKENMVRIGAADALGQLGDIRAFEPLLQILGDAEPKVREASAKALGQLGDARAVAPLINLLGDTKAANGAVAALVQLGNVSVQLLIKALENENLSVRQGAAKALAKLGDTHAREPLINTLKAADEKTRAEAAIDLGILGDVLAADALVKALEDDHVRVRRAAAEALDKLGWQPDERESGAAYWLAQQKFNKLVAIGAASVNVLIKALGDKEGYISSQAAVALGQLGDNRAVVPLIKALADNEGHAKRFPAQALGQLCDTRAVAPLIKALTDSNWTVRKDSAEALAIIASRKPRSLFDKWNSIKATVEVNHDDMSSPSDCGDHTDKGIGVPFPDKPKKLDF